MRCVTRREALKISGVGAAAVGVSLPSAQPSKSRLRPPRSAASGSTSTTRRTPRWAISCRQRCATTNILFLQQIGLRSIIVNFKPGEVTLDEIRNVQERFARHNIQVFGGINHIYRSLRIQLGQPGRDKDIEQYQRFLRISAA